MMAHSATQPHPHLRPYGDKRRAERTNVSLPVFIEVSGRQNSARLHNLSKIGAMIELSSPPPLGAKVRLTCGTIEAYAKIVWRAEDCAGIEFTSPIDQADLSLQIVRSNAAALRRSLRQFDLSAA